MEKQLRDAHGKPIPERLRKTFCTRDALIRHVEKLQVWESNLRMHARKPGGESIDMEAIRRHASAIQRIVTSSVPYELCTPECNPKQWLSIAESNAAGRYVLPEESL